MHMNLIWSSEPCFESGQVYQPHLPDEETEKKQNLMTCTYPVNDSQESC